MRSFWTSLALVISSIPRAVNTRTGGRVRANQIHARRYFNESSIVIETVSSPKSHDNRNTDSR
jgi:hypothetical protein